MGLSVLGWIGWATMVSSTFMIDHFDLFGMRQVYLPFSGREYASPKIKTRFLYKYIRHPIMLGFLIAFWSTPHMTQGHLLFAVMTTGYIMVAIQLEERDLLKAHGDSYAGQQHQSAGAQQNQTWAEPAATQANRQGQRRRAQQRGGDQHADLRRREAQVGQVAGQQHAEHAVGKAAQPARQNDAPRVRARFARR